MTFEDKKREIINALDRLIADYSIEYIDYAFIKNKIKELQYASAITTCATCENLIPIIDAETNETIPGCGQCQFIYFIDKTQITSCIHHKERLDDENL